MEPILKRLKAEGWHDFVYMRGDDMLQFPGRTFLEAEGVKMVRPPRGHPPTLAPPPIPPLPPSPPPALTLAH